MRILIAPDSFKGTLSANEVCDIIACAFEREIKNCEITKLPVADGGEGLCASFENILPCKKHSLEVCGPFGEKVSADYLTLNDGTAVIELASCAGLPLAGKNANPCETTTFGVGELINHAAGGGAKSIILGLGGSATNDGGAGFAAALGYRFVDEHGESVNPVGKNLIKISHIIPPDKLPEAAVVAACDVTNPLCGENGAAAVFAPQKGADEKAVALLDAGLQNLADVIKKDLKVSVSEIPGSGAAGGAGAGVVAFAGGSLCSGVDIVLDAVGFDAKAQNADIVISGEGKLDSQSARGKVVSGVARRAALLGKKTVLICGCCGEGAGEIRLPGVEKTFFATDGKKSFDEILLSCKEDLFEAAKLAAKSLI